MNKLYLIIAFLLNTTIAIAQNPTFEWTKSMGGYYGHSQGRTVAVDLSGNVYATGVFQGRVDFDPGPGISYLTGSLGRSVYVTKKDASGNLIWAKQLGGVVQSNSLTVHSSGEVYIAGHFSGVADFDPGAGIYNLTSYGYNDIFIVKLNSSGNLIWALNFGGGVSDAAFSIAVDASGFVYTTGSFRGDVDFDPGPGVFFLPGNINDDHTFILKLTSAGSLFFAARIADGVNIGNSIIVEPSGNIYTTGIYSNNSTDFDPGPGIYNLPYSGSISTYILKLSGSGIFQWAKAFGGSSALFAENIKTDGSGNVYAIGSFSQTVDFDPGAAVYNLTSLGSQDIYILKLNAAGNFVWAKNIGGGFGASGNAISLDVNGNLYCSGEFGGTIDFDPGPGVFNLSSTSSAIYVLKLSNSGTFIWAQAIKGSSTILSNSVAVDATGNVYTTGLFSKTCDFDPGVGTYNLVAHVDNYMFLSKLDPSGNFAWAHSGGAAASTFIKSMTTDPSGNIYTTGFFLGQIDFDPGSGIYNLSSDISDTGGDVFITKSNSSGSLIWAKQLGGISYDYATSIAVDAAGNVYTAGSFEGTADFDPGSGTFNLTASSSNADIFVSKLNPSGDFVWAKKLGSTSLEDVFSITLDASGNLFTAGSYSASTSTQIYLNKFDQAGNIIWSKTYGGAGVDKAYSIDTDAPGNIYITGNFNGTADFDPGAGVFNMTSTGTDVFISKLDGSGNFIWAKQFTCTNSAIGSVISLNASGSIYVAGTFYQSADFDPGSGTYNLTSAGSKDMFVSKLDNSGNFIWAKQFAGTGPDDLLAMAIDISDNVYTTGLFIGTVDFDPGSGIYNLSTVGTPVDVFISKLQTNGNLVWVQQIGSTSGEQGTTIALDGSNNIYTGGIFYNTVDFDPSAGVSNITSYGYPSLFVHKMNQCTTPLAVITPSGSITFCAGGNVTLNANTGTGLTYLWKKYGNPIAGATSSSYVATGAGVYKVVVTNAAGCSATSSSVIVTVNPLPAATATASGSTAICPGSSVSLNANTGAGLNYQWRKYSNDISGATGATYAATGAGTYKVRVTNANGCSKNSNSIVVTSLTAPVATITATGATTFCAGDSVKLAAASGAGNTYQWRKGSSVINGASDLNYYAKTTGNYKVTVTATNGCTKNSNVIAVNVPCRVGEFAEIPFDIYPNPSSGIFRVVSGEYTNATLEIKDVTGKLIFTSHLFDQETEIDLKKFPAGIYIAFLKTDSSTQMKKLIIR